MNILKNYLLKTKSLIRNFIYYFFYLLTQLRYKKLIRLKRNKLLAKNKIRVAFFITQKQLWCHQTVYENFLLNKYFDPFVVVFPNKENKINNELSTMSDNITFFSKQKIKYILGYRDDTEEYISLKKINADIIFYDQPFPGLPKSLLFKETSKNALICYVPYGYKIANFPQAHFNMDLQNFCWRVFAESDWHKNQFIKYSFIKGKNVVTSGYPKLDFFLNNDKINNPIKKNKLAKSIIWAPHWSINKGSEINFSTFDKNFIFFKELSKKYKNIYWIFKPHQRLRYQLEESGFMKKKDIDNYYNYWNNLENGEFYNESQYFEYFNYSDAIITDCGSFLAEYLLTKKPILHLINIKNQGYNYIGQKLVSNYYKGINNIDILNFIDDVIINNNDYLKEKRLKNLSLVSPNKNGAGKYIVDHIYRKIVNKN